MTKLVTKFAYFNPPELYEEPSPPAIKLWEDFLSPFDFYCERAAIGWWQEPLNAWSSLLFLFAAFAAFSLFPRQRQKGARKDRTRSMLCLDLSAIGLASWAFHISGWLVFSLLDVLAILVFTIRASSALFVRGLAFSKLQAFFGTVTILALVPLLASLSTIAYFLESFSVYLSPIVALGVIGALMQRRAQKQTDVLLRSSLRRSAIGIAAAFAVLAASLTMRTLDLPLCGDWTHGTHFLWHTLNALALFLVIVFLPQPSAQKTRP